MSFVLMLYYFRSDLFQDLTTEQVKLIANTNSNATLPLASSSGSTSLVYGEIDFNSFANILERTYPQPNDKFVDLGHGTGKVPA